MQKDEATPRPWMFIEAEGCRAIKGGKGGKHKQAQYTAIAYTVGLVDDDRDRANAALLVRAVNCHDQLVAALVWARKCFRDGSDLANEIDAALRAAQEDR